MTGERHSLAPVEPDASLVLPAPFDSPAGAYIENGRRQLTWSVLESGSLARNSYVMAWFAVVEVEPWRGEPLWLSAQRRVREEWSREPFTNAGRDQIADMVLPVVARYGFDRAWTAAYASQARPDAWAHAATEARRVVAWWTAKAELAELQHAGLLTFRRVEPSLERHARTQAVVAATGVGRVREEVAAEAVLAGEQVGWITRHGDLVPDGSILDPSHLPAGGLKAAGAS